MPSLLDKLKNRWNSGTAQAPNYGPIGPTAPRDARASWRQRLARWIGSGQSTPLRTASYRPLHQAWFNQPRDLPPFSFETINSMLLDPGIRLNLAMRAAPIYGVQFAYPSGVDASGKTIYQPGIQARNPAVAAWVARQLSTIWHNDLPAILRAQVYGWAGGEVSLRLSDQNFIEIDRLVARHPGDVRLLKCEGDRYGVKVMRVQEGGEVNLEFPSAWFHAFRPDDGEDYGTSILLGAYSPWADKWFNGGALDTRRLFMHKDAYGGMKIAYPEEDIYIGNEVNPVSARDIAAQMVEQRKAGGTVTYPSTLDFQGNPKWRIDEATTANNPQHILQYPKDCDDEIRIGMEIPDDVISADGSGAWAGKRIPLAAFYASLDTWVVQLLSDLRHTLEPLILLNWGRAEDFEICHKPLAQQAMEQQGQAASPPATTAQAPMIAGSSPQNAPHRMSTRPNLSDKERQDRYERSRLIAALLTHIYGPDAERYFDEAFGTNLSSTSSPSENRHPHEFQRMSSQISRSISFNRVPWDELKHPRGRDGRFIEKYGIDAFNESKSKINASLDPNASPTTGRTSDEVRPLLEHLNLLDQSQLSNLASGYKVAPDQTSVSPFADAIHHQVYGEAFNKKPPRQPRDEKSQYENAVIRKGDPAADLVKLVSTGGSDDEEDNSGDQESALYDASSVQAEVTPDEFLNDQLLASQGDEPSSSQPNDSAPAQDTSSGMKPQPDEIVSSKNVMTIKDVPNVGVQDIHRQGEVLSNAIRRQYRQGFVLADRILEYARRTNANDARIAEINQQLEKDEKLRRNPPPRFAGSFLTDSQKAKLKRELQKLTTDNNVANRASAEAYEELNQEFGEVELPAFKYLSRYLIEHEIPGGKGVNAFIARALRDEKGYGEPLDEEDIDNLKSGIAQKEGRSEVDVISDAAADLLTKTLLSGSEKQQTALHSAKLQDKSQSGSVKGAIQQELMKQQEIESRKRDHAREETHSGLQSMKEAWISSGLMEGSLTPEEALRLDAMSPMDASLRAYVADHVHRGDITKEQGEKITRELDGQWFRDFRDPFGQIKAAVNEIRTANSVRDAAEPLTPKTLPSPSASTDSGTSSEINAVGSASASFSNPSTSGTNYNGSSGGTEIPRQHQLATPSDLYLFGNATKPSPPRLQQDLKVQSENDIVPPQSPPLPDRGKSAFGNPLTAPAKGHYHLIPKNTNLPEGLAVVADGKDVNPKSDQPETHHTIYPTREMTAAEFVDKFSQIETTLAGKRKRLSKYDIHKHISR